MTAEDPIGDETPAAIVRRARGKLSLDRFAEQLGTSRQRVIAWEKGRALPSERYAAQIAARAGVDPAVFERDTSELASPEAVASALGQLYETLDEIRGLAASRGYLGDVGVDGLPHALDHRLRALQDAVEAQSAATAQALKALAAGIERIEQRIGAEAAPNTATPKRKRGET